jgi:hypothetical protein
VINLQGAHVLFPGESSLAIRAYTEGDMQDMDRQWPPNVDCWKQWQTHNNHLSNEDNKAVGAAADVEDFDGLRAFRNAFQMTVVLFILPLHKQREYLDNSSSLFHRAQRVMAHSPRHDLAKTFVSTGAFWWQKT